MRKQTLIFAFLPILFSISCDCGNDCGPIYDTEYYIVNELNTDALFIYKDLEIQDTFIVKSGSRVEIPSYMDKSTYESTDSCFLYFGDTLFNTYTRFYYLGSIPPEISPFHNFTEIKRERTKNKIGEKNDKYLVEYGFVMNQENLVKMK